MKLSSWIDLAGTGDAEVAKRLGITRQALWRYKSGDRLPRREILARIVDLTQGAVTANDFHHAPVTPPRLPKTRDSNAGVAA